jgi:drug/metabolite transporter (DMT)-like permease
MHITIFVGVPLLAIASTVTGQIKDLPNLSTQAYLLLVGAGLTQFLVGRYTLYRSFAAIGSNRSTPVRSLSVPFTLLMAVFILGERVSMINGIGIMIVVAAPVIMFKRESKTATVGTSRLAEGYFFALICALAFGTTPLLIRGAIGDTGLGIAGALVAYAAASVPLLLGLVWPGRIDSLLRMDRTALRWFLLTSFTVFFAHTFRFAALDLAPVTVVAPLMCTSAIWTVIFAFLINRQLEVFGPRILAAIALSIVGSVFVVF